MKTIALTSYSMLGSLTLYRRLLLENVFSKPDIRPYIPFTRHQPDLATLPSFGHGLAGIMAGTTVSFIAAPVEHVKARLQVQYAADKSKRMYSGPIDCLRKMVSSHDLSGSGGRLTNIASDTWYPWPIPWSLGNRLLPFLFLLLVGLLRHPDALLQKEHHVVRPCN